MVFIDNNFPIDISYGAQIGIKHNTTIINTQYGREKTYINWLNSRNIFNFFNLALKKDQMELLITFFRLTNGAANSFRFKDFSDYSVNKHKLLFIKKNTYQLVKRYSIAANEQIRKIVKPVISSIKIFRDNNDKLVKFTLSDQGVVLIEDEVLSGNEDIFASYEFDNHVRFVNDTLLYNINDSGIFLFKNFGLIEV
ncbi:MAG: DUF2460 domain-containing protein [Anaplasmataceae bacterium]|nr:DUF2460 domain-containing protein [Anaplasmataceae bacterium]